MDIEQEQAQQPLLIQNVGDYFSIRSSHGLDLIVDLPPFPSDVKVIRLTSVATRHLPSWPPNLEEIILDHARIDSWEVLPKSVKQIRVGSVCNTPRFGTLPPNLEILEYRCGSLRHLPRLPDTLKNLNISFSGISVIPNLPPNLIELDISRTPIKSLPPLPASLEKLCQSDTKLCFRKWDWPPNLTEMWCGRTSSRPFVELPDSLKRLTIFRCPMLTLPSLPPNLTHLLCNEVELESLPLLPSSLQVLFCPNNPILFLPDLPEGLIELQISGTLVTDLPRLPKSLRNLDIGGIYFPPPQFGKDMILPSKLEFFASTQDLFHIPELPDSVTRLAFHSRYTLEEIRKQQQVCAMKRIQGRCAVVKEELIATVQHPRRMAAFQQEFE